MSKKLTRRAELDGVKAVWYGYREVFLEGEVGYDEADKLAHYEDLEEAGRLIELPCEDVWFIIDRNTKYAMVMVKNIRHLRIAELDGIDKAGYYWSTKEKAEAELERRSNG